MTYISPFPPTLLHIPLHSNWSFISPCKQKFDSIQFNSWLFKASSENIVISVFHQVICMAKDEGNRIAPVPPHLSSKNLNRPNIIMNTIIMKWLIISGRQGLLLLLLLCLLTFPQYIDFLNDALIFLAFSYLFLSSSFTLTLCYRYLFLLLLLFCHCCCRRRRHHHHHIRRSLSFSVQMRFRTAWNIFMTIKGNVLRLIIRVTLELSFFSFSFALSICKERVCSQPVFIIISFLPSLPNETVSIFFSSLLFCSTFQFQFNYSFQINDRCQRLWTPAHPFHLHPHLTRLNPIAICLPAWK